MRGSNRQEGLGGRCGHEVFGGAFALASSCISSEVVREGHGDALVPSLARAAHGRGGRFRQLKARASWPTSKVLLRPEDLKALTDGIYSRQGLIEVCPSGGAGMIARLKTYLDQSGGRSFQVASGVCLHALVKCPSAYGDVGFSTYEALARVSFFGLHGQSEIHTIRVPLTEIMADSLIGVDELQHWQHPAFDAHLDWLMNEYGDVSQMRHRPSFIVPKRLPWFDKNGLMFADVLDQAFEFSHAELLRSLRSVSASGVYGMVPRVEALTQRRRKARWALMPWLRSTIKRVCWPAE